jgi:hypothetical protein
MIHDCKSHAFCADSKYGQRLDPNFTETAGEICRLLLTRLKTKLSLRCGCLTFCEKKIP